MLHRVSLNWTIAVAILASLVVTPWFFGGVWARTQSILLGLFAVLLAMDGLSGLRSNRQPAVVPIALYPLVCGVLLGLIQLWPLDTERAARFSPGAVRWRAATSYANLNEGLLETPGTASLPRSLYPPATRENIALLVLATSVFWLSSRYLPGALSARLMIGFVTTCGVGLALFALVQRFTWNGHIYWTYPLSQGGNPFGPFVNRNNAGGFLNLCVAAGLGAYVWDTGRSQTWALRSVRPVDADPQRQFGAARLLVIGSLVFMSGGIVASASRGSIVAMAFALALVVAGMFAQCGRRGQGVGIVAVAVAALALVIWLGEFRAVQSRFSQLASEQRGTDGRLLNWAEAANAIPDFWFLGSGLNTYRFVCPPFQDRYTGDRWHYYAENQYLQALVDGGIVALALLLVTVGFVGWSAVRLYGAQDRCSLAIATMGTFALASQVVGGVFDFGLYLGANAILMAAICGVVVGRVADETKGLPSTVKPHESTSEPRSDWLLGNRANPMITVAISMVLAFWAGAGAVEMYRAANVEAVVEPAVQGRIGDERDDTILVTAINAANEAVGSRPDDANGHRTLAELWIQRHRIATFRSLRQQQPWMDESEAWQASSLLNWNNSLREVTSEKRASLVRQIRSDPGTQSLLRPAWNHARRAQSCCPWVPQTYLTLASLAPLVGENPDTAEHLHKARQFAGGDPTLWYRIGLLDMIAGRTDEALLSWRQSLKLSEQYEGLILVEILDSVSLDEMLSVFPSDARSRLRLARRLRARFPENARQVAESTLQSWNTAKRQADSQNEVSALQAELLALANQTEESITAWRNALANDPSRTDWRLELIELLLSTNRTSQAKEQALLGLRSDPNSAELHAVLQRCKSAIQQQ